MNTEQKNMKDLLMDQAAVILDTETTGVRSDDRIIELSVIDMNGAVLYSGLFDPGMSLPDEITEITGITDADLAGKPTFADEMDNIRRILGTKRICGWNIAFDMKRLEYEYSLCGEMLMNDSTDAMEIYAKGMGLKANRFHRYSRKLVYAKQDLGIGESQEHRSLADCMDTLAVMKAFADLRNPDPSMCPDYAKAAVQIPAAPAKISFSDAVKAVSEGKRMTNGIVTNGELEELTIIMNCPFMLVQRPGQNSSSRLTKTPTVDDVLSMEWREM